MHKAAVFGYILAQDVCLQLFQLWQEKHYKIMMVRIISTEKPLRNTVN